LKFEFSWHIFKKNTISNFMEPCPVEAELFHAEGQTDGRTDSQKNGARTEGQTERRDEADSSFFSLFCERTRLKSVASLPVLLNGVHQHSSLNPQRTQSVSFTKSKQLNLYGKSIAAHCDILVEYT
jgi:hypothetical protein